MWAMVQCKDIFYMGPALCEMFGVTKSFSYLVRVENVTKGRSGCWWIKSWDDGVTLRTSGWKTVEVYVFEQRTYDTNNIPPTCAYR